MSSHLRRRLTAAGANRSFPRSDLPHTSSRQLLRYTTALNHPAVGQGLRGESVSAPAPAPTPRGSAALVPAARGTAERLQPPVPTAGPVAPPPPDTSQSGGNGGRTAHDAAGTSGACRPLPAPQPGHRDSVPHCGTSALPAPAPGLPRARPPACPSRNRSRSRSPSRAHLLPPPPPLSKMLQEPEPSPHLQRPQRPPGGWRAARRVM